MQAILKQAALLSWEAELRFCTLQACRQSFDKQAILVQAATLELGSAGMQAILKQAATLELGSAGMKAILKKAALLS